MGSKMYHETINHNPSFSVHSIFLKQIGALANLSLNLDTPAIHHGDLALDHPVAAATHQLVRGCVKVFPAVSGKAGVPLKQEKNYPPVISGTHVKRKQKVDHSPHHCITKLQSVPRSQAVNKTPGPERNQGSRGVGSNLQ